MYYDESHVSLKLQPRLHYQRYNSINLKCYSQLYHLHRIEKYQQLDDGKCPDQQFCVPELGRKISNTEIEKTGKVCLTKHATTAPFIKIDLYKFDIF